MECQSEMATFRGTFFFMKGVRFDSDKLTPELIKENFKRICSFEGKNEYPNYDPNWGHKVNEWMAKPKL